MTDGNYNPLANFTWEQLQYIYDNTPVGSPLRSNVASQLSALQQGMQDRINSEAKGGKK